MYSAVLLFFLTSCSYTPLKFSGAPPVQVMDDRRPGPVPQKTRFDFVYVGVDGLVRQPLVEGMKTRRLPRAEDVNALDQVPSSSWYTPRLGYREISPEELLRGPEKIGPPQKPITVIKAKVGGGNPGFVIRDARGYQYLMKFDPPEFPGIETTTALIVNRLFWGFGYNVPEDYLFLFSRNELVIDSAGELTNSDVDSVLNMVAPPVNKIYRSTASLYVSGRILGPIPEHGVRQGDVNDWIPHEDRRVLRALRVFCAFTHQSGMRPDNSLDVYEGEEGSGSVRHYLLDFGEAFGGHGAGKGRKWDGYEYFMSPGELLRSIFRPFRKKKWEKLEYTEWSAVGPFEGEVFEPAEWKETWRYRPFDCTLPDDDYWAAKIIAALTREHLEVLVRAAEYPTKEEEEYVIQTLLKRRQKILQYYYNRVTPLEPDEINGNRLVLTDIRKDITSAGSGTYRVTIMNEKGKVLANETTVDVQDRNVSVPIMDEWWERKEYLICSVTAVSDTNGKTREAQFHLKRSGGGTPVLAGILH